MSGGIDLPQGTRVVLTMQGTLSYVIAAPPGLEPDLDLIWAPVGVTALFTHDPGLCWTDLIGERKATGFLSNGVPCTFQFTSLGDALKRKSRLAPEERQ